MEENKPFGEGTAQSGGCHLSGKTELSAEANFIICLRSFCPDKLTCIHYAALGHNKRKFNSTLEAALMFKIKDMNGEMPHAY